VAFDIHQKMISGIKKHGSNGMCRVKKYWNVYSMF